MWLPEERNGTVINGETVPEPFAVTRVVMVLLSQRRSTVSLALNPPAETWTELPIVPVAGETETDRPPPTWTLSTFEVPSGADAVTGKTPDPAGTLIGQVARPVLFVVMMQRVVPPDAGLLFQVNVTGCPAPNPRATAVMVWPGDADPVDSDRPESIPTLPQARAPEVRPRPE